MSYTSLKTSTVTTTAAGKPKIGSWLNPTDTDSSEIKFKFHSDGSVTSTGITLQLRCSNIHFEVNCGLNIIYDSG